MSQKIDGTRLPCAGETPTTAGQDWKAHHAGLSVNASSWWKSQGPLKWNITQSTHVQASVFFQYHGGSLYKLFEFSFSFVHYLFNIIHPPLGEFRPQSACLQRKSNKSSPNLILKWLSSILPNSGEVSHHIPPGTWLCCCCPSPVALGCRGHQWRACGEAAGGFHRGAEEGEMSGVATSLGRWRPSWNAKGGAYGLWHLWWWLGIRIQFDKCIFKGPTELIEGIRYQQSCAIRWPSVSNCFKTYPLSTKWKTNQWNMVQCAMRND